MTSLNSILAIVSTKLSSAGVDCLLIGGFAVNYYGYTRNTLDIDFMILGDHVDKVKSIMQQEGFTIISIQENVVFFNAPESPLRVDFLRTDAKTLQSLLLNAVTIMWHGSAIKVPALKDLIAMKIFALSSNQPKRLGKDLPDIAFLITLHDLNLDTDIRPLCEKFGTHQTYDLICRQVEALRAQ